MKFEIVLKDLDDKDLEYIERHGTINIPDSTTEIADNACWGLEYLTHITIPKRVKKIGAEAFADCYHLESVRLPKNLRDVHHSAFAGCTSLKEVFVYESTKKALGEKLKIFPEKTVFKYLDIEKTK